MEAYENIEKNMRIDKLLRTILTTKGLLKNEVGRSKDQWANAKDRYSRIYSPQLIKSASQMDLPLKLGAFVKPPSMVHNDSQSHSSEDVPMVFDGIEEEVKAEESSCQESNRKSPFDSRRPHR